VRRVENNSFGFSRNGFSQSVEIDVPVILSTTSKRVLPTKDIEFGGLNKTDSNLFAGSQRDADRSCPSADNRLPIDFVGRIEDDGFVTL